jgi:hypothetical protein
MKVIKHMSSGRREKKMFWEAPTMHSFVGRAGGGDNKEK